ncbi:MAG: hypothetical protein IPN71_16155 [Fibrobacteres bacterium]|jgi:hypothetical protein|nr:hypothetical protein [Fibrobacterota bacterium]
MPTDPIKLMRQIMQPMDSGSAPPAGPAKMEPKGTSQSEATASQARDYVVSQSLKSKMSGESASGTTSFDLASANAKEIQSYYESAAKARKAEAASATKSDSLQGVLSQTQGATGNIALKPEVQSSLNQRVQTKEDAAMKAIDPRLANILGVSKIIGAA